MNIEVKGTRRRDTSSIRTYQRPKSLIYSSRTTTIAILLERNVATLTRSRGCARNCSTSRTRVERASTYARVCSSSRASHPTTLIAPYHARTSPPSSLTASYLFTSRASAFGLPCLHVSPLSLLSFTNRLAVSPKANSVKLDPPLRFDSSSSCVHI